mgnify:CR=1 FL=1
MTFFYNLCEKDQNSANTLQYFIITIYKRNHNIV